MEIRFRSVLVAVILISTIPLTLPNGEGGVSVVSPPPPSQGPTPMTSGPADAVLIDRLQQSTGGKVRLSYHARTGKVRFIGTDLEHPIPQLIELATAATPEQAARQFLDTYGQLFGLTDQAQELTVMHTKTADRGRPFVRFQQVYHGIPVLGGEVIVQLDAEKNVISANGEILPDLELNITPKLDIITAQEVARRFVAKGYGLSANDLQVSEPELWVYNPILLKPGLNLSSLVWRMDVYPTDLRPIDELVLIDAHRGAVILHFNQVDAARNREVYDNRNDRDAGLPGYGPVRTEGQAPTGIRDVDKAYDYAGDTYDFYLNMHGRDSLDNAGMPLVSTVRYCDSDPDEDCPLNNAFWWGRYQQIAYGQGYITDDVVTHEMTHGVTDFESNLFYYMQSGAINEAFSDIWGEFVDLTNDKGNDSDAVRWLHAEDLPTGANRNMKDPPNPPNPCGTWPCNDRQPDRMSNSTYYYCGELDNGGVHTNSGIGNKAAYLMVDGGTFSSHTITGIGIEKTAKILYEVQTLMFTSAADYNDLYDALQQACTNLIGTNGITAFDCQQVEKAVDATEMSQQPTACPAIEAPLCPAGEVPTNMFFDDLESGVDNWTTDTIIGTEGRDQWYYDDDYAASGQYALWGPDPWDRTDFYVAMNSDAAVPSGAYFHFNHAYAFDDFGHKVFDGGVVEYSTDGGSSWTDARSLFDTNGYNGLIGRLWDNPLSRRRGFVRESNGYYSSRADLSSLAGQSVRFRFRIGTSDTSDRERYGAGEGWYVDDVRIYTCAAVPPPTNTPSSTSIPTSTRTPTPTRTPTATPTPTPKRPGFHVIDLPLVLRNYTRVTPPPTATSTPTASATATRAPTATSTRTPTYTATPTTGPSPTPTAIQTLTPTATGTCTPGSISLDQQIYYGTNAEAIITVVDADLNTDPDSRQTVSVHVVSDSDPFPFGIQVTLKEVNNNSYRFTTAANGKNLRFCTECESDEANAIIKVADGDRIGAIYSDACPSLQRTATATWRESTPTPTLTATRTSTLTPTRTPTVTPTHTPTPTPTPSSYVSFDREAYYGTSATAIITVVDADLNTDPTSRQTVPVHVVSDSDPFPFGIQVTLKEVNNNSNRFTTAANGKNLRFCTECESDEANAIIKVADGDRIGAIYAQRTATAIWRESTPAPTPTVTVTPTSTHTPSPTGARAIVVNNEDKSICIIDATTDTVEGCFLRPLGIGSSLLDVVVTPDGRTAIVSNFNGNTVYFIDLTTSPPTLLGSVATGIYAEDIALSPDGRWALVTDGSGSTEDRVVLIDVANRQRVQTLTGVSARAVAVAPDGETVFVADANRDRVNLLHLNAEDGSLTNTREYRRTGGAPINVAISPDGRTALVANFWYSDFWSDTVTVLRIDGPGDVVRIGELSGLPGGQQSIAFSPDGRRAYVVSVRPHDWDELSVLNVNGPGDVTDSGIERINLGTSVSCGFYGVDILAVSPDGRKAYVGNPCSAGNLVDEATVVDLVEHRVMGQIRVGRYPTGIAFFRTAQD